MYYVFSYKLSREIDCFYLEKLILYLKEINCFIFYNSKMCSEEDQEQFDYALKITLTTILLVILEIILFKTFSIDVYYKYKIMGYIAYDFIELIDDDRYIEIEIV